jgi:biopolymer transport protein ExbD
MSSVTPKPKPIEDSESMHYVSERKQRGQPPAKLQPPLTPMIDVTFQLLLYFLLTSTFRPNEGQIPGTLPEKGAGTSENPMKPVKVYLRTRGSESDRVQYEVDQIVVDRPEELYKTLMSRRRSGTEETPVIIKPEASVRWKFVVEVFNAAVRAKYKNIGFASSD